MQGEAAARGSLEPRYEILVLSVCCVWLCLVQSEIAKKERERLRW